MFVSRLLADVLGDQLWGTGQEGVFRKPFLPQKVIAFVAFQCAGVESRGLGESRDLEHCESCGTAPHIGTCVSNCSSIFNISERYRTLWGISTRPLQNMTCSTCSLSIPGCTARVWWLEKRVCMTSAIGASLLVSMQAWGPA